MANWLTWKCGITLHTAREKVRVARALAGLPAISAAMAAGEVSFSQVRAMTRVATPDNEDRILGLARTCTAAQLSRALAGYRRARRLQAEEDPDARHRRSRRERPGYRRTRQRAPTGWTVTPALRRRARRHRPAGSTSTPTAPTASGSPPPTDTPSPPTPARPRGDATHLTAQHTRLNIDIDRDTTTPNWQGDRMDLTSVLYYLLPPDHHTPHHQAA